MYNKCAVQAIPARLLWYLSQHLVNADGPSTDSRRSTDRYDVVPALRKKAKQMLWAKIIEQLLDLSTH